MKTNVLAKVVKDIHDSQTHRKIVVRGAYEANPM